MKPLKAHPAADVFPMMNQSDLEGLAADIKRNGLQNPIVLSGNQILDGRNRLQACKIAGVKPAFTQWKNGKDPVDWIISQNLHRRHLNEDQRAIVAAKLREELKRDFQTERAKRAAKSRWKCLSQAPGDKHRDSRVIAAKLLNVSRSKVGQAIEILQHKDLAEKVATGQTTLALARRIVFQRERESVIVQANKRPKSECRLEHCDFRKLLPTLHDVDLIVIDPPYSRSELPLFEPLAILASKALAPQGTLAVMTGQSYLPEYVASLSTHLEYRWTLCYAMPQGSAPNVWPRKANPFWKPILIYQLKGAKPKQWIKKDIVTAGQLDKNLHPWQQDLDGFRQIIEMLSEPGNLVVDCFLGSGTTALAAMQAEGGRRFVGCDVDLAAVRGARGRLGRR
jgi:16S rRNA G966 N2-methylase RsmD